MDVTSDVPTALPALNSEFTTMVLTPSGVNHWDFGDDAHTTSYDANGVEYAPLVGVADAAPHLLGGADLDGTSPVAPSVALPGPLVSSRPQILGRSVGQDQLGLGVVGDGEVDASAVALELPRDVDLSER